MFVFLVVVLFVLVGVFFVVVGLLGIGVSFVFIGGVVILGVWLSFCNSNVLLFMVNRIG